MDFSINYEAAGENKLYGSNDELVFEQRKTWAFKDNNRTDILLFERNSPIEFDKSETKNISNTNIIVHSEYPLLWNSLQPNEKELSRIVRTYWLGKSWNSRLDVSKNLIQSLSQTIKCFKHNIKMCDLFVFDSTMHSRNPSLFTDSISYRDWFQENKSKSKYEYQIVLDFCAEKAIKPIQPEYLYGFKTPILTAEEIEGVYQELRANPEPKLEARPSDFRKQDGAEAIQELANVLKALIPTEAPTKPKGEKANV